MTDKRQQNKGERCETCEHYRPKRCLRFPMGGYPLRDHWCREYQNRIAQRVLAELAKRLHNPKPESVLTWDEVKALTAPYLPKPEPDRLMVAARECANIGGRYSFYVAVPQIRAIIAREVAAAGPSDEALWRVVRAANNGGSTGEIRAALEDGK